MGKTECLQEKPKDTKTKTYIWTEIKNNPNLYCWVPISKKNAITSNIDLDTVNVQDIPPPTPNDYGKKIEEVSSKLISITNKKYIENLKKGIDLVSYDDPKKYAITKDYIKRKKLKVYGGTAINYYLPKEYKIYNETENADYDVYSIDPWNDAVELAHILYDNGYKYVEVKSRLHKGTYSVVANLWHVIDVTYLPPSLYNKLETKTIKGLHIVAPVRLMEQLYKELSIPFYSPERFEKISNRLNLLSYFKPVISKKLKCPSNVFSSHPAPLVPPSKPVLSLLEECNKFISKKELLISGKQAYNLYIQIGGGNKLVYINEYTVLSEDAHSDIQKLLTSLLKLVDDPKQLQINTSLNMAMQINKTFYTLVYIENNNIIPLCTIHQLDRCTGYKKILNRNVVAITYLKYILLLKIVYGNTEEKKIAKCMYGYLSTVQKHYYKTKNISEFEDTPFQKYVVECKGPIKNIRKHHLLQQRWHKKDKPDCEKDEEDCLFPCTWDKKSDKCIAIPQSYKIK